MINPKLRGERKALGTYFKEIGKTTPLSAEEEVLLAQRAKEGNIHARNKLVEANVRFAAQVALQYKGRGLDDEDLIGAGNYGLMIAAERFDETRGFKFISYAVWWVRQAVLKALDDESRSVRLPSSQQEAISALMKANKSLEQRLNRNLSMEETQTIVFDEPQSAKGIEPPARRVPSEALNVYFFSNSLDSNAYPDKEGVLLKDILADTKQELPDSEVLRKSLVESIYKALSGLKPREANIIESYYGLKAPSLSLEEIGSKQGVTRERIRQLREGALKKLRSSVLAKSLAVYAEDL